jgi:cytochrome c-type biogenesis protein CcmH
MPGSSPGKAILRWREWLRILPAAIMVGILLIATPAQAVRPDEMLADPALEARAREVSRDLRCLVCRNQSIDDSDADLAHDLRVLVRERLTAGDSNEQVIGFVHARYGDFVLLRPPFAVGTALLWGGPLLVLLLGGVAVARFYRRRDEPTPPLSPEERQRLSVVLGEEADRGGAR